jgi:hypothetical protein
MLQSQHDNLKERHAMSTQLPEFAAQQAMSAQTLHEHELLAKQNVVGVGVGLKESNGQLTDQVAVVVLVEQKKPLAALTPEEMIPRELEGMRTDVIEVGHLWANQSGQSRQKFRPVIPSGVSVGHFKVTAGTLGTIVRDKATGDLFMLSNNHVLANSNDAVLGDAILQPAAMDGGQNPADMVARLERYVKIDFIGDTITAPNQVIGAPKPAPAPVPPIGGTPSQPPAPSPFPPPKPAPTPVAPSANGCVALIADLINLLAKLFGSNQRLAPAQAVSAQAAVADMPAPVTFRAQNVAIPDNYVDCALARPLDAAMFSDDIRQIGLVNAVKVPVMNMNVRKYGRTTEYTEGTIRAMNATVNINYSTAAGNRTARFVGQVITSGMSQGGDSGSLVVDKDTGSAVGLLFAGSDKATIFTPIQVVLDVLEVTL